MAWNLSNSEIIILKDNGWTALTTDSGGGNSQSPLFGINTTPDSTNRLAAKSDAVLLSHDDQTPGTGDISVNVNRADTQKRAAINFQTGYASDVELGLLHNEDFQIRLNTNGNARIAARVDHNTGVVSFDQGLTEPRRSENANIDSAGGTDWWGPADPMVTNYSQSNSFTLSVNRLYFSALYLPLPLQFLGGFVCQSVASTTAGAVLRAGLYRIGNPDNDLWNLGDRIVDLGGQSAENIGHKFFDLATPVTLEPGWYLSAIGTNGASVRARSCRWMSPGLTRLRPFISSTTPQIRLTGIGNYLFMGSMGSEIATGLPPQFTNSATPSEATNGWSTTIFIPKWRRL